MVVNEKIKDSRKGIEKMKIKPMILGLLLISTGLIGISTIIQRVEAQPLLLNDTPNIGGAPVPDDYQFDVLNFDHAIVGVKPVKVDNFDIAVYTDTTFTTLIESSTSMGNTVDFVVLDKTTWAGPPNRGIRVTSGTTSYVLEMENDVDDYFGADTWSGTMESFSGNPVLIRGPPGSWDDDAVGEPTIHYDGLTYHMWYGGGGSRLRTGYATSPDGITWTKHPSNPVLNYGLPSFWDEYRARSPSILFDGITYHMWYSGSDGTYRIGYATSPDGITWTKYPGNFCQGTIGQGCVLDTGPSTWDSDHVSFPMVIHDGMIYHMWYAGRYLGTTRIGHATSSDGITWTKSVTNPVLNLGSAGSWDDDLVYTPRVLYNRTTRTFNMWYAVEVIYV